MYLGRWCGLLVKGESVSEDQAKEILIRTALHPVECNDHLFVRQTAEIVYKTPLTQNSGWLSDSEIPPEGYQDAIKRLGILKLNYLRNEQIASAYVGGPHGWCDWNGKIGCNSYSIGKRPTVEEVYEDWQLIASTFPFLDLRCQLLDSEIAEGYSCSPVVEFVVSGGTVTMKEPPEIIAEPDTSSSVSNLLKVLKGGGEIGCTLAQFKEAVLLTEKQVSLNK